MSDSAPPIAVNFSRYGNSANYCREGWCAPAAIHTCTSGPSSSLELPRPDRPGCYLLRFDVSPDTADTHPLFGHLTVLVNGTEVGCFTIPERAILDCPVPWELIARSPL